MTRRKRPTASKSAGLIAPLFALLMLCSCGSKAEAGSPHEETAESIMITVGETACEETVQTTVLPEEAPEGSSETRPAFTAETSLRESTVTSVSVPAVGTVSSERKTTTASVSTRKVTEKPKVSTTAASSTTSAVSSSEDSSAAADKSSSESKEEDTSSCETDTDSCGDSAAEDGDKTDIADSDTFGEDDADALEAPPTPYAARYFLNGASEEIKKSYRRIFEGLFNSKREIVLPSKAVKRSEIVDLMNLVVSTGSVLSDFNCSYEAYLDREKYVTKVIISYKHSAEKSMDMYKEMNSRAERIVAEASSLPNDYEKIKFFHDTIIRGCCFDERASDSHTAYGALCGGKAVCEGYSKAFMVLCDKAGIPCLPYCGSDVKESDTVPSHIRNMVQCGGKWYVVDVTWDDQSSDPDAVYYDYFMIDEETSCRSQRPASNSFMTMPKADDPDGDYFARNGLVINNDTDLYEQIHTLLGRKVSEGSNEYRFDFRCSDKEVYDKIDSEFLRNESGSGAGFGSVIVSYYTSGERVRYIVSASESVYVFHLDIRIS